MAERATIIGAGIVGICTAISLLEKGFEVVLVDRDGPAEGASHGNAGVISPWTCVPQSMPGTWRSIPKWLLDPEGPVALRWGYLPKFIPWALKFLAAGKRSSLPAAKNFSAQGINLGRYPHLSATGPSGSSSHFGILRQVPGIDCGTQVQGEITPALP